MFIRRVFVTMRMFVGSVSYVSRAARGASVQVCVVGSRSGLEAWMSFNLYSTWSF